MTSKKSSKKSASKPTITSNAQGTKVAKDRTVGAHVPASEQCEHKAAKHHSKGKCTACYNKARNSSPRKSAAKKSTKKAAK